MSRTPWQKAKDYARRHPDHIVLFADGAWCADSVWHVAADGSARIEHYGPGLPDAEQHAAILARIDPRYTAGATCVAYRIGQTVRRVRLVTPEPVGA